MAQFDIRQALTLAQSHFSGERLVEAERLCRHILDVQPHNLAALFMLGLIACRTGRAGEGVELLRRVALAKPGESRILAALAEALSQAGRPTEALEVCRQGLDAHPDHAGLLFLQANAQRDLGALEDAGESYRRVLATRPDMVAAVINMAGVLHQQKRYDEAVLTLQCAIGLQADSFEAYFNLGNVFRDMGNLKGADASYRQALSLRPDALPPRVNLGATLVASHDADAAVALLSDTVALHPQSAEAHLHLALALRADGQPGEALVACQRALRLRPDWDEALFCHGNLCFQLDDLDGAEASFRQLLAGTPGHCDARLNLGVLLRARRRLDEAEDCYRQTLAQRPDDVMAHVNLAHLLLLRGDFQQGWQEYEWRRRGDFFMKRAQFIAAPQWAGEPLAGRTVLLYAEQGAGDTLQFLRYAPLLAERGARVVLEVQPNLVRLAQTVPGVAAVVGQGAALPPADYHFPLHSLPAFLGTAGVDDIPRRIPYLSVAPESVALWRDRLSAVGEGLRVGVVWSGSSRHPEDRFRSLPVVDFLTHLDVPGIRFFSLQKTAETGDMDFLRSSQGAHVTDLSPHLGDFADTAAAIMALDLLVTADTAPAHLAGALGRPAWVLLPYRSDWRWLLDQEDNPWYPTLRLLRQAGEGDWRPLLDGLRAELRGWARQQQG